MLLIEQEEKHGPTYLCVKQVKVDKDPLISQELQVLSPDKKGIKFFHDGKNFFVKEKHMLIKQIHTYDVDPLLQKMNPYQLQVFQKTFGFIIAKRLSNGEYKLNTHVNGDGGKPGFDTVITVGKVVLDNASTVMKVAEKAATVFMLNTASKWVTGKNFWELSRGNHYDPEAAERMKQYEKQQNEYHRDMRIKHGLSPMDTSFKWNEKKQCFVDENGDHYYNVNEPVIQPQTDVVYTGRTLPIVSPSKPVELDENIGTTSTYTPEFYEDGTRIVDYENNPEDKAWLEDFAKKICPGGGYSIGDTTFPFVDEELPSTPVDVAMPMPTPPSPNDPEKDKFNKQLDTAEHIIEHVVEHALFHANMHAAEKLYEKIMDHHSGSHGSVEKVEKPPIVSNAPVSTPKTTANQKMPNYDSGKRLQNWNKAQEEKKSSSNKTTSPAKVESVAVKQEPVKVEPIKQESSSKPSYDFSKCAPSVKIDLDGEKIPTQATFSSAPKESLKEEKTYATKSYEDDFYSKNNGDDDDDDFDYSSPSNYSSSSSSSSHSSGSSYQFRDHYDMGCTLFKNEDQQDNNPDRYR